MLDVWNSSTTGAGQDTVRSPDSFLETALSECFFCG
jgi:hypothetical protein